MTNLAHFQTLARKLEAASLAWNAQTTALNASINMESGRLAELERRANDPAAIAQSRAKVRKLKQERASAKAPSFVNPLADCERYAATHPGAESLPPIHVEVPPGQTPLAAHNIVRERTDKVLAEISRMASAPIDDPAAIAEQVAAIATPARIHNGRVILPRHLIRSQDGTALSVVNMEGLFAWLHHDALVAALQASAGKDGPGLTRAKRDEALAELYTKFASALRIEAAAAMAAEKADQPVIRRRHVHPAVLLGLKAEALAIYQWHATRRGV